jgi:poly(A) polymerase
MASPASPGELAYRQGEPEALDILALRAALSNVLITPTDAEAARHGAAQRFPLKAEHLAPLEGPALGQRLKALERAWIDSGFTLSPEALLRLP